ncbi:MAG: amino acid adenylation domain-containing protein [Gammaproteobacteria bacterium]|nr:amino acid adenylation domain-containing protein [Gammaproteobacteria bacterium]
MSGVVPEGMEQAFPCSFAQQRLWFLEQLERPGAAYNLRLAVRLRGDLDIGLMQRALDAVVARHEALRSSLRQQDGELLQLVAGAARVTLEPVDLEGAGDAALRQEIGRLSGQVFDLARGPLLRAWLLRAAAGDQVLLLLMHHVVSDAWSSGVLFRDLMEYYGALRESRPARLPELPVQYVDYAAWQREWLQGEALERQLAWWREALAGAPPLLELPTDRPRPAVQGYRGNRWTRLLDRRLVEELQAFCQREGCTPFMLLLAVFDVLLARCSGQHDIVVGTPVAGRRRSELEPVVGFFANTLVMRADLADDPAFRELLARVRRHALLAAEHQDLPFEKLVEALQPLRSLSHAPLFQVMFILQNTPWEAASVPGLVIEPAATDAAGTAKFDLTLSATGFDGELWLGFEYNSDLFDASTIARYAAWFEQLLRAALAAADTPVSELPLAEAAELAATLASGQGAQRPLDPRQGLHDLVAAQVARRPDAIALECGAQRWSYAELDGRAAALAARLQALGAGPGTVVGIALERSPEMVAALLGVLRTGAAWLPLDPAYPDQRLHFMLRDSGARWLITQRALAMRFASCDGLLCIEDLAAGDCLLTPPRAGIEPGQLAYLIYTSGSSGEPKGVRVGHTSVVNFLRSMQREPGIDESDRWLAVTTLSFDIAVLELLGPLSVGATVVIATAEQARDATALAQLLDTARISVMQATPATWRALLASGWNGRPGLRALCGGEALPAELAAGLLATGMPLWNLYGPTETTVWSSCARIGSATDISAGLPIDNTQFYILDAALRPLPDGVPGEICIGGAGVAQGYHARPELTAARFVTDSFRPLPGARLYRSGDRGRRLADGRLQVLGRLDGQLKLRGFRIEAGEVEAALARCAGVAQCAVGLRAAAGGEPALVAWLVADGAAPSAASLRAALRPVLPEYMVPAHFLFLERLPLTANGKLDRRALPAPVAAANQVAYTAPRTPLEATLCALFAEVLDIHRALGIDEDFFALGGHSLLATRLLARLRALFSSALPLRALFESPTVASLAPRLATAGPAQLPPLLPRSAMAGGGAPLSPAQQRLWFLEQLEPGSSAYHLHAAFRLHGRLDPQALEQALQDLADRHEALRSSFGKGADGNGEQRIAARAALPLERLAAGPGSDLDPVQCLLALVERPFDLARGPLLRAALLDVAPGEWLLLLVMHHIVADGWSMAVLFGELSACYAARCRGESAQLPPLGLQYPDYASWQRRWLEGGEMARQLDYWRGQLAGLPACIRLPADRPRRPLQRHRGARLGRSIDRPVVDALQQLARTQGATLFMVLLAGFQALLARYTGDEDLAIGTPVAGRGHSALEGLVGFFVNTLVLRGDLRGNPTLAELLARTRRSALDAFAHAELPFEKLVEILQPRRSRAFAPLAQLFFVFHSQPRSPLCLDGASATPELVETGRVKFDLALHVAEEGRGLVAAFAYDSDLFDEQTVSMLAGGYARLLGEFARDAQQRLGEVAVLEGAQPQAVVDAQRMPAPRWGQRTLAERFAAVAAAQPSRPAVRDAAGEWSYAQLQAQADALAARLAAAGARGRVALLLGHDRAMVAGLLGTLRAGCAYVPLDPYAPRARQEQLLADAGATAIVTDTLRLAAAPWLDASGLPLVLADAQDGPALPPPPMPADPAAPAYLLFTSGTTGRPQPVEQAQGNVLGLVGTWASQLGITPDDRLALFSGYGYDAAVQDLFGALLNGAAVHCLDLRGSLSAPELVDRVAEQGVTILHCTPTVYRWLFGGRVTCDQDLSRVRLVVLGGEEARRSDLDLFKLRFRRGARFVNGLGLTECTTVLQYFADHDTRVLGEKLPVGLPVPGVEVRVIDDGWQGEVEIASPWLAHGCGPRYRSGDRLRRLPDGQWQFAGRTDRQLKLRGIRVEPGEVEAALAQDTSIREAAVIATELDGEELLAAYVVPAAAFDEAATRRWLRKRLPEYMVPGLFIPLAELPRRANGKLDAAALPAPGRPAVAAAVPARNEIERRLLELWAGVLGRADFGVHDDFFALGGHSLLATRLIARVRDAFALELPLLALFEAPTIAGMAQALERTAARPPDPALPALRRRSGRSGA